MKTKKINEFHLRWMRLNDAERILEICPSTSLEIIEKFLSKPNNICSVICSEDKVIGFMIYGITKYNIFLHHLAVDPSLKRKKIASKMLENIISKLNKNRKHIKTKVSEYNLPMQLFLKAIGFNFVKILKKDCDFYLFEYCK